MEQLDTRAPVDCDDFLNLLHTKSMSHERPTNILWSPFLKHTRLTDPLSRENFDKYGHPDGRQGFQMGIALPRFLLDIDGASAKLWKFFTKAAEYMEIPVRRTDDEPLQKLFMSVWSELNLDLKNMKQEQAKFWKQHPAIVEAVPLSARKSSGVSSEGIAPFLWLPHFSDTVVKKIARKKVKSFQELQEISLADRSELLTQVATDALFHTHPIPVPQGGKLLGSPRGFIFEQRVVLSEGGAITAASKTISDTMEGSGAGVKETSDAVREAIEIVKSGSALVKVLKRTRAGTRGLVSNEGANAEEGMEVEEEEYDDYESEYSEDEDDKKDVDEKRGPKKANGTSYAGLFFKEDRTNGTK
uniref:Uncharacterized protein n=1 Tax=Brassica campestris TaxID=3711 RepID=M4CWA4_BRACM